MDEFLQGPPNTSFAGTVEEHPEYKLVVQANRLIVDIDNEIAVIHKARAARRARTPVPCARANGCRGGFGRAAGGAPQFVRDHYAPKFPELDSLVLVPLEYMRVVKAIGNETVRAAAGPSGRPANASSS